MSLYGEAIAAIRSVILIDERVQAQSRRTEKLADEVAALRERLVRVEAILEVALARRGAGPAHSRPAIGDERR
jgi:hypothetical protein